MKNRLLIEKLSKKIKLNLVPLLLLLSLENVKKKKMLKRTNNNTEKAFKKDSSNLTLNTDR